jgi:glycosyltransferase involved in cell wall biosynthesis
MTDKNYTYTPLAEPTPISEQVWPEGTIPLVATSTLTYNHEPYIRDCLDGILMQKTTFPVRVVVFEDCSTDATREIVKEYQEKYPNLFVTVFAPHNTYGKPERREALKPYFEARAVAKYIALCEGDDYWTDPLKLQKQVEFLEVNHEYVLVHTNVSILYERSGKIFQTKDALINNQYDKNITIQEAILSSKYIIRTASVMVRNNILSQIVNNNSFLFSNNFLMGDTPLWYSLSKIGKFQFLPESTMVYRRHFGSATNGTLVHKLRFKLSMYELRYYLTNKDDFFTSTYKDFVQQMYKQYLYKYMLFNNNYSPIFPLSLKKHNKFTRCYHKYVIILNNKARNIYRKIFKRNEFL